MDHPAVQRMSSTEARRYNVQRSCIRCHQRKIRCDKSIPCATCVKTDNAASCRYPGPERIKRQSKKRHLTSLEQQVERLEQIVSDNIDQNSHLLRTEPTSRPRALSRLSEDASSDKSNTKVSSKFTGLLVRDGNVVRYVNDQVLTLILEKEEEARHAMTSPQISNDVSSSSPSAASRPLSFLQPINHTFNLQDTSELLPQRVRAVNLWRTFVANVDPVIKLLHIPTMQPVFYAALNQSDQNTDDLRALLFAIYFSAMTSTTPDVLESSKDDHEVELSQYRQGLEISLSQGNFLDQPTMYSLQAMTIFSCAFRYFDCGRSTWALNGMVIRVAQLMGIHRDSKLFNLSPFDQEMRHRLWWKIITIDSRALEDQAIWVTGTHNIGDARLPLNINDCDIGPTTTAMPIEHLGFTETTSIIAFCHIHKAGEAAAQLSLCADLDSYLKELPNVQAVIARTREIIQQKLFFNYNPHIPVQNQLKVGTDMILQKLEWRCREGLLRHQQKAALSNSKINSNIEKESEELFERANELLYAHLEIGCNEVFVGLIWYSLSYLPYDLLTFILWRLCMKPHGSSADQAWKAVSQTFSVVEQRSFLCDKGARWSVLCKLKDKVGLLRARQHAQPEEVEFTDSQTADGTDNSAFGYETRDTEILLDDKEWDMDGLLFSQDWATFQQNLNLDGLTWTIPP